MSASNVLRLRGRRWSPTAIVLAAAGSTAAWLCILAVGVYAYLASDLASATNSPSQVAFRADEWKHGEEFELRYRMHEDLLRRYELVGMSQAELLELLGPGCNDCQGVIGSHDVIYYMGPEPGFFRVDSAWLAIDLGPDARVERYEIVTD